MATPLAPMLPLGVTPRPPINPAHRSLRAGEHFEAVLKSDTSHPAPRLRFLDTTPPKGTSAPQRNGRARTTVRKQDEPGAPCCARKQMWAVPRGHSSEGPALARSGQPKHRCDAGCGGTTHGDVHPSKRRRTCTDRLGRTEHQPEGPSSHSPSSAKSAIHIVSETRGKTCFSKTDHSCCTSSPSCRLGGRPRRGGWTLRGLNRGFPKLPASYLRFSEPQLPYL